MPIPGLNRAVVQAINVGRSVGDDVRAVYITDDPEEAATAAGRIRAPDPGRPAGRRRVAVPGARRARCSPTSTSSMRPGRRTSRRRSPSSSSPNTSPGSWWERILYNQSAKRLRTVLLGRPHTVVVAVPYRREDPALFEAGQGGPPDHRTPAIARRAGHAAAPTRHGRTPSALPPRPPDRPAERRPGGIVTGHVRRPRPGLPPSGPRAQRRPQRRADRPARRRSGPPRQGRAGRRPCRRDRLDAAARRRYRRPIRGGPARPRHGRSRSPRTTR